MNILTWPSLFALGLILTGCGGQGPSEAKIRADLDDWMAAKAYGLLKTGEITITERKRISEDRLQYRVSYAVEVKENNRAALKNSGTGKLPPKIRRILTMVGQRLDLILRYKKTGDELWTLDRIEDGRR